MRILLNTLLLSFLVGCGHGSAPPPSEPASQAGMKKPATPDPASKPQSDQSPTAQPVPSGWVKIVNQQTEYTLFGDIAAWKIEQTATATA